MSNAAIQQAQQVDFVFHGKGRDYTFKFLMIPDASGTAYPWIPVKDVEQHLYFEEQSSHSHLQQELTPNGRMLDARAATMLKPELRMVTDDGRPWVRASGVFQVLCRMNGPVCEAFRDQLGSWLESEVAKGAAKIQSGGFAQNLADAGQLQGNGISMLRMLNQQFEAVLTSLEDHQQKITAAHQEIAVVKEDSKETRAIAEASRAIAEANAKLVQDAFDQGWLITLDYLKEVAPDMANQDTSFRFGQFLAKAAKDNGAQKRQDGWFWKDGRQVSKRVPWPGHVSQTLNKWKREYLDAWWPRFVQTFHAQSAISEVSVAQNQPAGQWAQIVDRMESAKAIKGIALQIARLSSFVRMSDAGDKLLIVLRLHPMDEHLAIPIAMDKLRTAVENELGRKVSLEICVSRADSAISQ